MTSYECLGWMRLENFIYAKKLLFVRSIATLKDNSIYKEVFKARMHQFNSDICRHSENKQYSPIFDILKVAILYGLYNEVWRMINGTVIYSKQKWKEIVWSKSWVLEKESWRYASMFFNSSELICRVMSTPCYSIWWEISDENHYYMKCCEVMVKLMCNASRLRIDDYEKIGSPFSDRVCRMCNDFHLEDANHLIMQCSTNVDIRRQMYEDVYRMPNGVGRVIMEESDDTLATLLGRLCPLVDVQDNKNFLKIVCCSISKMYWRVLKYD